MVLQYDYVGTLFDNESNPGKVTVALTMGNKALEKGYSCALIFFIEAVYMAVPGKLDNVDIGAPFKPAKELLEGFLAKGGQILVCNACMKHNNVSEESIDKRFKTINADDVIDLVMGAKGTLQIS